MTDVMKTLELAKMMHGKVPSFDDNYIETYLPKHIFNEMLERVSWVDADGLTWGFQYTCALMNKGNRCIAVASRADGMGCFALKVIDIDDNDKLKQIFRQTGCDYD
jgi:hypothetical protein